jgi:hypothetical protein
MAEDQIDRRKEYVKELAPWTKLFSAFKIALDPKKLLLAGGGILVMSLGWYVLSVIFFSTNSKRPEWPSYVDSGAAADDAKKRNDAWERFKRDRHQWYLLYEMAGTYPVRESPDDKKNLVPDFIKADLADESYALKEYEDKKAAGVAPRIAIYKPYGKFRTLPWFEDRGPNPYLLVTGGVKVAEGHLGLTDWIDWFFRSQLPVLLEPLFKFFQPIVFLFDPAAGTWNRIYLFLIILWSLATWAFFGAAITRIAAVQIARPNERVSLAEAVKFVIARYKGYLTAPLLTLVFLGLLTVVLLLFGFAEAWTFVLGDIIFPILWPIVLLIGLVMAVVLVGLVGWPLMYTTISAEGSDSFDAISRSYSYVYQAPWHYLWYALVALVYGAVLVFFVGLMGSLMVYLGKWGVTLAPTMDQREPSYLFRWAPTSFGWRDLLLHKSTHATSHFEVSPNANLQPVMELKEYSDPVNWHNNVGAFFVALWLYLLFLLIVGFGYSYFWTASTIIYLLMRRKVDDTEMDEIYLDEEPEQPFPLPTGGPTTPGAESPLPGQAPPQMVESPQLRTPAPVATAASPGIQPPGPVAALPTQEPPRPDSHREG